MPLSRSSTLVFAGLSLVLAHQANGQTFQDRWWSPPVPKANAAEAPPATEIPTSPPAQTTPPPAPSTDARGAAAAERPRGRPGRTLHKAFVGKASYYAYKGGKTASGNPFRRSEFTAASRTLPFGTRLKVTDLQTDKSVHVTVTDRGPSKHAIMLDLSPGAAKQVGLDARRGIATVRAEIIQSGSEAPPRLLNLRGTSTTVYQKRPRS